MDHVGFSGNSSISSGSKWERSVCEVSNPFDNLYKILPFFNMIHSFVKLLTGSKNMLSNASNKGTNNHILKERIVNFFQIWIYLNSDRTNIRVKLRAKLNAYNINYLLRFLSPRLLNNMCIASWLRYISIVFLLKGGISSATPILLFNLILITFCLEIISYIFVHFTPSVSYISLVYDGLRMIFIR